MGVPTDTDRLSSAGVYAIRNLINGKRYIGSAVRFRRRFKDHRRGLRKGKHHCAPLLRAWVKYGEKAFVFEIIELVDSATQSALLACEQSHLDAARKGSLYNICLVAASQQGMKRSDDIRARMRLAAQGRKRPPSFTDEHRQNLSRAAKGRVRTPEHCEGLRQAHLGRKLSPEHRKKIGDARRGKSGPKHTAEAKLKISLAQRGRTPTLETRAKMRIAALAREERKRQQHLQA